MLAPRRSASSRAQTPGNVGGREPKAIHPCVGFHVHADARGKTRRLEHPHLLGVVHDDVQPVVANRFELGAFEESFEQQDRA